MITRLQDFFLAELIAPVGRMRTVEVELTTNCVSKCVACPRIQEQECPSDWNFGNLSASALIQFWRSCGAPNILFCGAYGDPIYHPQYLEIVTSLTQNFPSLNISTETNGSHRDQKFWRSLGARLGADGRHSVVFSIDGLADTNSTYRRGTNWKQIIDGAKALRESFGGHLMWKWILFRHNEHQVGEGFRLSRELGFSAFRLVNTVRHFEGSRPTVNFEELLRELEMHP